MHQELKESAKSEGERVLGRGTASAKFPREEREREIEELKDPSGGERGT